MNSDIWDRIIRKLIIKCEGGPVEEGLFCKDKPLAYFYKMEDKFIGNFYFLSFTLLPNEFALELVKDFRPKSLRIFLFLPVN